MITDLHRDLPVGHADMDVAPTDHLLGQHPEPLSHPLIPGRVGHRPGRRTPQRDPHGQQPGPGSRRRLRRHEPGPAQFPTQRRHTRTDRCAGFDLTLRQLQLQIDAHGRGGRRHRRADQIRPAGDRIDENELLLHPDRGRVLNPSVTECIECVLRQNGCHRDLLPRRPAPTTRHRKPSTRAPGNTRNRQPHGSRCDLPGQVPESHRHRLSEYRDLKFTSGPRPPQSEAAPTAVPHHHTMLPLVMPDEHAHRRRHPDSRRSRRRHRGNSPEHGGEDDNPPVRMDRCRRLAAGFRYRRRAASESTCRSMSGSSTKTRRPSSRTTPHRRAGARSALGPNDDETP